MNDDCQSQRLPEPSVKQRLLNKLFPYTPCFVPEAPSDFKDCVITKTRSSLGALDRIRVLVTGKIEVECKTVTQHIVGQTFSESVCRCGRFWE